MINKQNKKLLNNSIIIFTFAIIAILNVSLLLKAHVIDGAWDLPFHWGRIYELVESFHDHVFLPHFNVNTMSQNGTAIMLLYPYITLLPFVIVLSFFKFTITLFYIFFSVIYFIGLLISFYSSKSISKNILTSYVFAILYCTSAIFMTFSFTNMDIGALLSFTYMPLVIFGFIHLMRDNHWTEMTIGVILLIFTHVLSVLLVASFVFVWLLTDLKATLKNKTRIKNIGKSVLVIILTTSFLWIPAVVFLMTNTIKKPINFGMPSSLDLLSLIYTSVTNNITMSWGFSLFAVIGLVIAPLIFYRKFSPFIKKAYWVSFGFAIFSTGMFPWEQSLSKTPLSIIQFPWRLDMVPQLFFIYILSTCITKYIQPKLVYFYVPIVLVTSIVCQLSCQQQVITLASRSDCYELSRPMFKNDTYNKHYNSKFNEPFLNYKISKDSDLKNALDTPFPVNDYPDYYPKQSFIERENLSEDLGSYGLHTKKLKPLHNGTFKLLHKNHRTIHNFALPFVDYNGVKYQVYDDHHLVPSYKNNTCLLTLNRLSKGSKLIKVKIQPNRMYYVYYLLSLIGIIYFIYEIYRKKYRH
ncbi:YfhO family protein [uncultured bacterium]|nr:YfhO family protein [uncultured bacterium]